MTVPALKIPVSVLVVIHTAALEMLLIERAARPGFWQSVTGSLDSTEESPEAAALREVAEETGIAAPAGALRRWNLAYTFEIYAHWRHRFVPGALYNTEHVFSLRLPERTQVRLAPEEHRASTWLPWRDAAEKCFSWSNRDAIRLLAACGH